MTDAQDDEYEIPLRDQRFFGSGLKRKRIHFVASTTEAVISQSLPAKPSSAADRYLSIVLKKPVDARAISEPPADDDGANESGEPGHVAPETDHEKAVDCEICHRPLSAAETGRHESSIAHQICLQHSHPPSDIDRRRKGFAVLESQGWDPDSRLGLGATGEGRLQPVRATKNPEKAGLGMNYVKGKPLEKSVRLDAGKTRMMEQEGKKKAERLRNAFYRDEKVEQYLGQEHGNPELDVAAFQRSKRAR